MGYHIPDQSHEDSCHCLLRFLLYKSTTPDTVSLGRGAKTLRTVVKNTGLFCVRVLRLWNREDRCRQ